MTSSILNLCARIDLHASQRGQLIKACNSFQQWDDLLHLAEKHGMGPLLYRHLTAVSEHVPGTFLRGLRFLCLRHQQANARLMKSLHSVLSLFEEKGISSLVLKGGALCQTLYPEIGLRPMRDIDLLLDRDDVMFAHTLLQKNGFAISTEVLPEGYYHLSALHKNVDGMQVCLELHHGLFPKDPPYYKSLFFEELYTHAQLFDVGGKEAYTLADEEMLWHLYQHGFHAPLTYEPFKLISVADIVSLVEKKVNQLDWEKIRTVYPQLFRALPLFHHITPWSDRVIRRISYKKRKVPSGVGEHFKGWPHVKLSSREGQGIAEIFYNTFFPGRWWLMLYYSTAGNTLATFWCSLVRHPIHIIRWVKVYVDRFVKSKAGLLFYSGGTRRKMESR